MSNGASQIAEGVQQVEDEAEARAREEAQRALENAEDRIAEAQRVAQQVTDAALQTELGRQIQITQEAVSQCRTELSNQAGQLTALTSKLEEILLRLPAPSPSIPPPSEAPPVAPAAPPEGTVPPQAPPPESAEGGDQGEAGQSNERKPKRRKM